MKYILKQVDDISGSNAVTTVEFNTDTLSGILQHFELFIRGCGFYPPEGNLDFVNDFDNEPEWQTEEWDTPQEEPDEWTRVRREDAMAEGGEFHSKYYFDTERNK